MKRWLSWALVVSLWMGTSVTVAQDIATEETPPSALAKMDLLEAELGVVRMDLKRESLSKSQKKKLRKRKRLLKSAIAAERSRLTTAPAQAVGINPWVGFGSPWGWGAWNNPWLYRRPVIIHRPVRVVRGCR